MNWCHAQTATEAWCHTCSSVSGLRCATRNAVSTNSAGFETTKSQSHSPAAPLPMLRSGGAHSVGSRPSCAMATTSGGSTRLSATVEKSDMQMFHAARTLGARTGARRRMQASAKSSASR
eukprot:2404203-Prymnesium_polylepis.2